MILTDWNLRVNAFADQPFISGDRFVHSEREGSLRFAWSKPGAPQFHHGWGTRTLTLELSTSAHRWLGSMKLYRFYRNRALLVNPNLLPWAFPAVRADALDRRLVSKKDPVSELDNRVVIRARQG